jgi:hypothetical protein
MENTDTKESIVERIKSSLSRSVEEDCLAFG